MGREKAIEKGIYLDYQATTPVDLRVFEAMKPYFCEKFGNAHSRTHKYGWESEDAVEHARNQVAKVINASNKEIVFTSGATESNNLAIQGVARFYKSDEKDHIITVATEHKCILDTCRYLEQEGFKITYLPVEPNGIINLDTLRDAITDHTIMVSVMAVNSEIGVIQPLKKIGEICKEKDVFFHTDAAQGYGKIPIDVKEMHIDLMSISGHKIYGPKGIGALYVSRKPKRVRMHALIHGGGQERGMRSGTLPTPLIVGLGKAAEISNAEMETEQKRIKELRDKIYSALIALRRVYLNGDLEQRISGNLNLSFAGVEGESLIAGIKGIAVSSGSACTSASLEPSYVLRALGVDEDLAHTSLRIGIGRFTTEEEVDAFIDVATKAVNRLREMSPLWEMMEEGIDIKSIRWVN